MTGSYEHLNEAVKCKSRSLINLPTGETSQISHYGTVNLENELKLKNVIYIPAFKHNILSINKLCEQYECKVVFYKEYCIIQDAVTSKVIGVGKGEQGLYYLMNEPLEETLKGSKKT